MAAPDSVLRVAYRPSGVGEPFQIEDQKQTFTGFAMLAFMPKSELAQALDRIQEPLAAELRARQFKMLGRTFNRQSADGLTQVIHIQMGSFDPPGTTYHSGLRDNLYGKVTVNLGVYVPEVATKYIGGLPKRMVHDYNCCIRARLGTLGTEQADIWWSITQEQAVVEDLLPRIRHDAMFFFARYESRDLILSELNGQSENMGGGHPPRIICAVILANRGDFSSARGLLLKQAQETRNPGHPAYVRGLAEKLGLGALE
jgi:hypothetical protein